MERDKVYISFNRPKSLIGYLIVLWTFGKYSHCEFVINDIVYFSNPGGVRKRLFDNNRCDIYKLDDRIRKEDIKDFFGEHKGKEYDYLGVLGQFFYANKFQNKDKYFCSEFCLNAIDYALGFTLRYKNKLLKDRGNYGFSPTKLYKYLKKNKMIERVEYGEDI